MKYLYILTVFFLISCKNNENVLITNKNLVSEIKSFIKEIDKNHFCKSDYLTVEIGGNEIQIGNYKPKLDKDFIGKCKFDKSEIYFFSSSVVDCSNYILITDKISVTIQA
jgi:hypothetical protein